MIFILGIYLGGLIMGIFSVPMYINALMQKRVTIPSNAVMYLTMVIWPLMIVAYLFGVER